MNQRQRQLLLSGASFVGASFIMGASDARAQTATLDEVVVTASRVARSGFEAPTPTTVLSADNLFLQGASTVTQALNQIPAFVPTGTPATTGNNSAAAGQSFLNLRGIGAARTLVLVNGRRHVASTAQGTVDANVVPAPLVRRVEVVTGGASAAWGSDAVAGVVNYILDSRYEGLKGQAQYGVSEHGDAKDATFSVAYGAPFADGRGHFVVSGEHYDNSGILNQSDRAWGRAGWMVVNNPSATPSNGQPRQLLLADVHQSRRAEGGLILTPGPLFGTQFAPGGAPQPFNFGTRYGASFQQGGDGVNIGRYTSILTPVRRESIFGSASYDLQPKTRFTLEGSYVRTHTNNEVVSSFNFAPYTIRSGNPYIPASVRAVMVANGITELAMGRINTDMGYITADITTEVYRGVAALDGEFGENWKWSAYYQFGETRRASLALNNLIPDRLDAAIDAVSGPAGTVVCRNAAANPGCVPINLFGFGSPSPAAIEYVTGTQSTATKVRQQVAAFDVSGEPFSTWAGPVSAAAGAEYRQEWVRSASDALSNADAFLIGNPKNLRGRYNVKEAFAEVVVPLAKDLTFARSFELNGAARITDYSTSGSVSTWKIGANYEPVQGVRFRGTLSRDIRAANISELFQVSGLAFETLRDPRNGASIFIPAVTAGNVDLKPEKADTKTVGIVIQPSQLSGLRLSADYYDIKVDGAIGSLASQDILDRCYDGGNAALCGLIVNNPDGSIKSLNNLLINIQNVVARGADFEVSYSTAIGDGSLGLSIVANYVKDLITSDGVTSINRAGQVAGEDLSAAPKWRGLASAVYTQGRFRAGATVRYVGSGKYDTTFGPLDINDNSKPDVAYLNLSASYTLREKGQSRLDVYGFVNNVLDKNPPIIGDAFLAPLATNGTFYDVIGRQFTMGIRFQY